MKKNVKRNLRCLREYFVFRTTLYLKIPDADIFYSREILYPIFLF